MAFCAQLTEQGHAQRLSGAGESQKELQAGRGDGPHPPHLLSSPSKETPAVRAARADLCQPVCLNFKHNLDHFLPQMTNSLSSLRSGSRYPHSYTGNKFRLSPIRVSP